MNQYDVVIHMNEPRYWVLLLGSFACGWALIRRFKSLKDSTKNRALTQMGWTLILLQVAYQCYMVVNPDFHWSVHRSLPLHFCGINIWLMAINCFCRNRALYLFTSFLGTIGGFHAILTPQLTVGDDLPLLIHFYVNHAALIVVPIIMTQSFHFRFQKWGWMYAYLIAAGISTVMAGFNQVLNTCFPGEVLANYMYMTEPPKADNPFVFRDLAWPWYVLPLHAALILHSLFLNLIYRWTFPAFGPQAEALEDAKNLEQRLSWFQ